MKNEGVQAYGRGVPKEVPRLGLRPEFKPMPNTTKRSLADVKIKKRLCSKVLNTKARFLHCCVLQLQLMDSCSSFNNISHGFVFSITISDSSIQSFINHEFN